MSDRKAGRSSDAGLPASGWFWLENQVVDLIPEIGITALSVYIVLCRHAGKDRTAFPATRTIANIISKSRRTVHRAITRLIDAGLVQADSRDRGNGSATSSVYTLPLLPPRSVGDTSDAPPKTKVTPVTRGVDTSDAPPGHQCHTHKEDLLEQDLLEQDKKEPAKAGDPPEGLLELIDGWNGLGASIIKSGNGARRDPPAKAALAGWKRAQKEPEQQEAFQDVPKVIQAIRQAKFCHGQGWFSLPWLFGKNRNGEFNVVKLLAGAHNEGAKNGKRNPNTDPGSTYIAGATGPGIGDI